MNIIMNQRRMIGNAKYHLFGFPFFHKSLASSSHFIIISFGINLTVRPINRGRMIKSSKYPRIGIKSGIKSIGDNAYATVSPAIILASRGVSFFFNAKDTVAILCFNSLALCFKFI